VMIILQDVESEAVTVVSSEMGHMLTDVSGETSSCLGSISAPLIPIGSFRTLVVVVPLSVPTQLFPSPGLHFYPQDGRSEFLLNVCKHIPN
jgi:hypothetical protein